MGTELTPTQFDEIIAIIEKAKARAIKAVNAELIQLYWNVGEYLSNLVIRSLMKSLHILLRATKA